ncbi:MAG: hydroxymethylglutaryl-CoA lyase [Acidimicrobiia bacterium]|nr:hydroxymethylglutaryl-CoA lyase [Acidimicrobiia bacterium]
MTLPARVQLVEVGPRDGLQNEAAGISTADKIAFVNRLSAAGHTMIEVSAFVSPKWVPQMADAAEVFAGITRRPGVRYTALVPNLKGLERAKAAHVDEVAIFPAASETFSRRNIDQTIDEALDAGKAVCDAARSSGLRVRAYLSTVFGCPFEGAVPAARVAELTARLLDMGAYEVSLSDTIGVAHPGQVAGVLHEVGKRAPADRLALHFHDTRGTALVNVYAGVEAGVTTFDASAGGLGGCPYAPGATGNAATEDLLYMLDGLGIATGVRLDLLMDASAFIEPRIGHPLPSRVYRANHGRR